MKKIGKWVGIVLLVMGSVFVVLAFLPVIPLKSHPNIDPDRAAQLRAEQINENLSFVNSDGQTLFVRKWLPDSLIDEKKNTAILIFHGVTAHSGPYKMAGEPFAARGYATFGLDYRGHGLSDGHRGDYESREVWKEDLSEGVRFIKSLGYDKVIVLGHSLGVAAAIYCYQKIPEEMDGLILLSGGYRGREGVREKPDLLQKLHILSSSIIRPSYPVVHYFREGMTGQDDPLFNFSYTLRFLTMVKKEELGFSPSMNIPVMVAVGDEDELFEVDAVREVFDDVPGDQKEFMVLKGAQHAHIPPGSWEEIGDWIDRNYTPND